MMSKRRAVHFRLGALLILFAIVSLAMGTSSGFAADSPLSLHPKASLLPFTHQGPFVTTGDGGVLCVDAQNALHSRDEGRTWTSVPIFRNATKFKTRDERALLRTHDGTVIAAWMNEVEKKSPPGWNWGKSNVDCRMFVLPIYVVSGRKRLFLQTARDIEGSGPSPHKGFFHQTRSDGCCSRVQATPPLSDLAGKGRRPRQAAKLTVSARARWRASNSRPITCRL